MQSQMQSMQQQMPPMPMYPNGVYRSDNGHFPLVCYVLFICLYSRVHPFADAKPEPMEDYPPFPVGNMMSVQANQAVIPTIPSSNFEQNRTYFQLLLNKRFQIRAIVISTCSSSNPLRRTVLQETTSLTSVLVKIAIAPFLVVMN